MCNEEFPNTAHLLFGWEKLFTTECCAFITEQVLYISLHRHEGGRFYPGTGAADEVLFYLTLTGGLVRLRFNSFLSLYVKGIHDIMFFMCFVLKTHSFEVHLDAIVYFPFLQVGSMGAEGYCVNIPWSRGGVGDNDYIFAFEQVVLPIGRYFISPVKKLKETKLY